MDQLNVLPDGIDETAQLIADLDNCFLTGFARLNDEHKRILEQLKSVFSASPLKDKLTHSIDALNRGALSEEHFTLIAAVRSSLNGALYDGLMDHCAKVLDRIYENSSSDVDGETASPSLLENCRKWLTELAITGFRQLDVEHISPFRTSLEALLPVEDYRRLSVLLNGMVNELEGSCPIVSMTDIPIKRWTDLWSCAMMHTTCVRQPASFEPVSGELFILGTNIQEHANLSYLEIYALLKGETVRLVRIPISAFKTDTIVENEIWKLFHPHKTLLKAMTQYLTLNVSDMQLFNNRDLIWEEEKAEVRELFDPFKVCEDELERTTFYKINALDRHPVHISELIHIQDYTIEHSDAMQSAVIIGDVKIPISPYRLSASSPIEMKDMEKGKALIALIRFDGGRFQLQPLSVQKIVRKKGVIVDNTSGMFGKTQKKPTKKRSSSSGAVEILKERASRLLRK